MRTVVDRVIHFKTGGVYVFALACDLVVRLLQPPQYFIFRLSPAVLSNGLKRMHAQGRMGDLRGPVELGRYGELELLGLTEVNGAGVQTPGTRLVGFLSATHARDFADYCDDHNHVPRR